jgi:hypothetical protein
MDASPKLRYIPGHDPEARSRSVGADYQRRQDEAAARKAAEEGAARKAQEVPPPVPGPSPKGPEPTADPVPCANGGDRAWSELHVTYNVGNFESIKVGAADYAGEGETRAQLEERILESVFAGIAKARARLAAAHGGAA